ncbi:type II toxin-antitoxin system MqsA family antitoxin [Acidithiobacillus thiooxidans]|uniref:type II toxin-antitoxin system MqsA family antitoxin n=1 Tax=Acidithiobacillus thiooxidans TaxID=930 RepID=UPI001F51AB92|nr:type II toxin-antitoxin system MqsA family antitoxin [Acidithiobacillus thiooxidans]
MIAASTDAGCTTAPPKNWSKKSTADLISPISDSPKYTPPTSHARRGKRSQNQPGQACFSLYSTTHENENEIAHAHDDLIHRARSRQREDIRRIRRKLHLTQVEAARLTGGGRNAFSRYERGEASPMPAMMNLLRLLDNHPELLLELNHGHHQNA